QDATGFAAAVPDSLGPRWAALRCRCALGDERGRPRGQRPVRAQVGPAPGAAWTSNVFCASEKQSGCVKTLVETDRSSFVGAEHAVPLRARKNHVKKSRILNHAPASGSAQVWPLRNPIGAAGNLMPSNGMSSGSPQICAASFAPNQVAAATPWPANPAAK